MLLFEIDNSGNEVYANAGPFHAYVSAALLWLFWASYQLFHYLIFVYYFTTGFYVM